MPLLGGQEPGFADTEQPLWDPSDPVFVRPDPRVIPKDKLRIMPPWNLILRPPVPIYITERDIADMDRREDSIERMEKIVAAQQAAQDAALQQAAQVRMQPFCPVCC